jgi:hypothetical protein
MKKIFSLLVMLVMTATAFAQSTSEKLLDDGYAPNGSVVPAKAITVDWATQKLVVNVNLANCSDTPNECIFSVSTNATDIANWDQESGSTLHLFYTKNASVWTANGWETYTQKFAVQYRYVGDNGATNHYFVVSDPSNCTIVMDKNGITMDGTLVFPASEMPNLYKEGANQLYFGSVRAEHTYATYKSVELVTEGGTTEPTLPTSYEITDNAMTMYVPSNNGEDVQNYTQYMKDAKLQVEKDAEGKYTVTFNDVVAGKDRESLGTIVFAGLDAPTESEDLIGVEIPQGRVCTIYAEGSSFDNHMFRVVNGSVGIVPPANEGDPATAHVMLSMSDDDGNMLAYKMGDVFIPVDHNFTSDAYVKVGDQTTNFANSEAVLTEFMEDVYKVTFKNITIGEKTGDFTVENLEPTEDADGNLTFTTSDTYGFWNDADETVLDFTDFSASVKVGENGFEGFVCKFTTENGQFVYGEKAETPEPPSVVETKIFSDKLEYTLNTATGTNDPQKLTIESLGNDRYNVILANLDTYNVLYVNVGTVSFKNVAGKTENGVTTIEAEKPEVTFTDADYALEDSKEGKLKVMFNNDKAYLDASGVVSIPSFGMSYNYKLVYGTEFSTEEPKDDYAINFDKDAKQTHSSRYSTSVSLQQEGKDKQTIEFGKTMNGYEDLTAGTEKFTVEAGSEVTPSIGYVGEWMHGYVYIDLNNDKQFSFNADGADQTGTEVVSYSYYKDQNSKGEAVANSCNVNPMPSFTAPTTPGTYRIRFKVDWDNIDAGGSVLSTNHILNNGGGIYDATLEVVEPVTDGISTINAEVANGEAQLFTVDGVQIAKLQKGLNIVRSADCKVKKVLVK